MVSQQEAQGNTTEATGFDWELSGLQADVARKILALIGSGKWQLQERISDAVLSRELNVSRSPVRYVLNLLTEYGLLAHVAGKGYHLMRMPAESELIDQLIPESENTNLYNDLMTARAMGVIGTEVSETELVEQFKATRGAVRRALMRFSAEGLAERLPGHGWRFTESLDNERAVQESYTFRLVVECGALLQPDYAPQADQLQALLRQQQAILDLPVGQLTKDAWFHANAAFHETIVSWANNRFFTQSVRWQNSLRRMTEYADFGKLSEKRLHDACHDHIAILRAIQDRDINFAAALLRRHISRSSRDDL